MALRCALSSYFSKGDAAFWSYGSLGLVFSGTGRRGIPRLAASGGGVVDEVLCWQLGNRLEMVLCCVFYHHFRLAVKCISNASGPGQV